jgi:hypothetical protein
MGPLHISFADSNQHAAERIGFCAELSTLGRERDREAGPPPAPDRSAGWPTNAALRNAAGRRKNLTLEDKTTASFEIREYIRKASRAGFDDRHVLLFWPSQRCCDSRKREASLDQASITGSTGTPGHIAAVIRSPVSFNSRGSREAGAMRGSSSGATVIWLSFIKSTSVFLTSSAESRAEREN